MCLQHQYSCFTDSEIRGCFYLSQTP